MEPRYFHIWDFPESTRVKLSDQEDFLRALALKEGYGYRWYITPVGQANLRTIGGF